MKDRFQILYDALNPSQKEAVDAIEGPVMVIAGPGTGKTHVVTLRIANILRKTDTPPDGILALTFTENAAREMRERLVPLVGSAAYRVKISTFHGFANEIIHRFPDEFPRIIGGSPVTEIDQVSILKDIILSEDLDKLRPFGNAFYYLHIVRGKIADLKRENVRAEEFARLANEAREKFDTAPDRFHDKGRYAGKLKGKYADVLKKIEKNIELSRIYIRYTEELKRRLLYDFEDMLIEVVRALEERADFLLTLQEEYLYFLADEHQDANNAQNRFLDLLAGFHESPNLFVVGDAKQAIFRFQGASVNNFISFTSRYATARVIALTHHYRSRPEILTAAESLIEHSNLDPTFRPSLTPIKPPLLQSLSLGVFDTENQEYAALASHLVLLQKNNIPLHTIAILFRENRMGGEIREALLRQGIPSTLESDEDLLRTPSIRRLSTLIQAAAFFGDDAFVVPALHVDVLQIPRMDLFRIIQFSNEKGVSVSKILESEILQRDAGVTDRGAVSRVNRLLANWAVVSANETALTAVELIARESGFLGDSMSRPNAQELLSDYASFFSYIRELSYAHREYMLQDLVTHLALLKEHNLLIKKVRTPTLPGRVRLLTIHRAKGMEFDHVYIAGVTDRRFGQRKGIDHFSIPALSEDADIVDKDETERDDRRLLYVALTRARETCTITYATSDSGGVSCAPSRFIEEIGVEKFSPFGGGMPVPSVNMDVVLPKTAINLPIIDREYLFTLFMRQGLSVTALNNYLSHPWNYFFRNLIRIPERPSPSMLFGTAIHGALRTFYERFSSGDDVHPEDVLELFQSSLNRLPLDQASAERFRKKARRILIPYVTRRLTEWERGGRTEWNLDVLLPLKEEGAVPHVRLRGVIDRAHIHDDGSVTVIDYKTEKPKTRGVIEGTTKSSDGDYKRQLIFYGLLLSLHDNGKNRIRQGEIDFVEPDSNGEFRKEIFTVTKEEIVELTETITRVSNEIATLAFLNVTCDPLKCNYCDLMEKITR